MDLVQMRGMRVWCEAAMTSITASSGRFVGVLRSSIYQGGGF